MTTGRSREEVGYTSLPKDKNTAMESSLRRRGRALNLAGLLSAKQRKKTARVKRMLRKRRQRQQTMPAKKIQRAARQTEKQMVTKQKARKKEMLHMRL